MPNITENPSSQMSISAVGAFDGAFDDALFALEAADVDYVVVHNGPGSSCDRCGHSVTLAA